MRRLALALAVAAVDCSVAGAQPCGYGWIRGPENAFPGVGGIVEDVLWFDPDGPHGPEPDWLFAAGFFIGPGSLDWTGVGGWDGTQWRQMSTLLTPWSLKRLAAVDGVLYASSGQNSRIFRWTLADQWSMIPRGSGDPVRAMVGHQGRLIVGSAELEYFESVDAPFSACIAAWDGAKWNPLPPFPFQVDAITALESHENALYAGYMYYADGTNRIAGLLRLENDQWSVVPDIRGDVEDLCASQGLLYVSGLVSSSADSAVSSIAAFNGSHWDSLGGGLGQRVTGIAPYRDGVVAVGEFTETVEGLPADRIAAWFDGQWHALDGGPRNAANLPRVQSVATLGDRIAVGGDFSTVGGVGSLGVALWDDSGWHSTNPGIGDEVYAIRHHGNRAYLGGRFRFSSTGPGSSVAAWDGRALQPVGDPLLGNTHAFTEYRGRLIAGGAFVRAGERTVNRIAQLENGVWQPLGAGLVGTCRALAQSGEFLYAGGALTRAGGMPVRNIARWDGAAWSDIGGVNGQVNRILPYGNGVIVGGQFTEAGGVPANSIAYWDGLSWSPFGAGFEGIVHALIVHDGVLYAGGALCRTDGVSISSAAKWTGTQWIRAASDLGSACSTSTYSPIVYDFVEHEGDLFAACGALSLPNFPDYSASVLRLDGTRWVNHTLPLQSLYQFSLQGRFFTIASFGPELLVGGQFLYRVDVYFPKAYAFWARWSSDRQPWFVQQPVVATDGEVAHLSVVGASGYDTLHTPLSVRWHHNGVPVVDGPEGASEGGGHVTGADAMTMTIASVQGSDAGAFMAELSNGCATVSSHVTTLDFVNPLCPADMDASGVIDAADFVVLAAHFGTPSGALRTEGDCNADGRVDAADVVVMASQFGLVCQ